jgi:ribulose-5-phosphate 4-epimerase/fuculose-1-phosphate aldolase
MDGSHATPLAIADERQLRIDLAAAFRLADHFGWTEAIANHFSLALGDGRFLINPFGRHFSTIRASDLAVLNCDLGGTVPEGIDVTAWMIHGTLHAKLAQARCILHLHPPYATALSCLADPAIKPIDQTSARFFQRVALDTAFGGMADNAAEGERLCAALGDKSILMMGNHGVLVTAPSVAEAFDAMYHLERASRTLVLAYSTGQQLNILSDEIAEKTARSWEADPAFGHAHFAQMKLLLDRQKADYAA